ncbi:hypothetical protein ACJJTC_013309 [Scirpophaga incertulas]
MPTSWVYQLRKEDLIRELEKRGKSTENLTVEELRRQLTQMVKDEESHEEVYQDTMAEKGREKNDSMSQNTTCQKIQESFQENTDNIQDGKIWKLWENSIEKWNIHFDGTGDPVEFIEKIEELIDTTGADKFKLLPIIPRILQDIQTLMRRQGNLSEQERLERIFENMDPNCKYYIKRQDFETLRDLIKLAIDYERIIEEKCKNLQKREGDVTSPATRYARLPPRSATRAAHQAARTRNPAQTGLTALWCHSRTRAVCASEKDRQLQLSRLERQHGGRYACSADNGVGPALVTEFTLQVLCEY